MNSIRQFFNDVQQADYDKFNRVATSWFRAQFKEMGCAGAVVLAEDDWTEEDAQSTFGVICRHVANRAVEVYEFKPLTVVLIGLKKQLDCPISRTYGQVGLRAEYESCSVRMVYCDGQVKIDYSWPQPYSTVDEDGTHGGGSHSDRDYLFDLADPQSLEHIIDRAMILFDLMLRGRGLRCEREPVGGPMCPCCAKARTMYLSLSLVKQT